MQRFWDLLDADLDDPPRQDSLAVEFHALVASSSRNPVLTLVTSAIAHVYADHVPGPSIPVQRRHRDVEEQHVAVMRAIVGCRPATAEMLMRQHMATLSTDVRRCYPGLLADMVAWG